MAATGILPDQEFSGGVVIRDEAGLPTNPVNVQNAYSPSPEFLSTCLLTALPSDCEARITPAQINAIVSELISFAECMDPDGTWTCASLNNLCTAFAAWVEANYVPPLVFDGVTIIGDGTAGDPLRVGIIDSGTY